VVYAELSEIDRWALSQLAQLQKKILGAYGTFEFHAVFHSLLYFCTVTMSSFYLDIIKDRLYVSATSAPARRGAQTVLYELTEALVRLMAPVLIFTAAEAWEHLPPDPAREPDVALAAFPVLDESWVRPDLDEKWERLIRVRGELTKILELARQNKVIGHPLEAAVAIKVGGDLGDFLGENWEILKTIAIVSELHRVETIDPAAVTSAEFPDLAVLVKAAAGGKCERCWIRAATVGETADHPTLCRSCVTVVASL
jgi:isoleucyl-tRNA synthetase